MYRIPRDEDGQRPRRSPVKVLGPLQQSSKMAKCPEDGHLKCMSTFGTFEDGQMFRYGHLRGVWQLMLSSSPKMSFRAQPAGRSRETYVFGSFLSRIILE